MRLCVVSGGVQNRGKSGGVQARIQNSKWQKPENGAARRSVCLYFLDAMGAQANDFGAVFLFGYE